MKETTCCGSTDYCPEFNMDKMKEMVSKCCPDMDTEFVKSTMSSCCSEENIQGENGSCCTPDSNCCQG